MFIRGSSCGLLAESHIATCSSDCLGVWAFWGCVQENTSSSRVSSSHAISRRAHDKGASSIIPRPVSE